jgi:hypothetical protein
MRDPAPVSKDYEPDSAEAAADKDNTEWEWAYGRAGMEQVKECRDRGGDQRCCGDWQHLNTRGVLPSAAVEPETQIHEREPNSDERYRDDGSSITRSPVWVGGVKKADEVDHNETCCGDEGIGNEPRERPSYDAG